MPLGVFRVNPFDKVEIIVKKIQRYPMEGIRAVGKEFNVVNGLIPSIPDLMLFKDERFFPAFDSIIDGPHFIICMRGDDFISKEDKYAEYERRGENGSCSP